MRRGEEEGGVLVQGSYRGRRGGSYEAVNALWRGRKGQRERERDARQSGRETKGEGERVKRDKERREKKEGRRIACTLRRLLPSPQCALVQKQRASQRGGSKTKQAPQERERKRESDENKSEILPARPLSAPARPLYWTAAAHLGEDDIADNLLERDAGHGGGERGGAGNGARGNYQRQPGAECGASPSGHTPMGHRRHDSHAEGKGQR